MKKYLALLLALVMMLALAACAKDPAGTGDDATKGNPPSLLYLYNTSDAHKAIGEYLQSALAAAGITMTLENQEWATFLNTRKDGQYTIARNGWVADYTDPICFLDMWVSGSGNNDVQYGKGAHKDLKMYNLDLTGIEGYTQKVENGTWAETYDVLISLIKSETNTDKRYKMMHIAEDMLMDTGCICPLYFYTDLYMIDDEVKGFFSSPLGYKYFMNSTYKDNSVLNVCLASEPDSIDPALNSAVDGATLLAHLFSGIAKWSMNDKGNLEIVADCATELPAGVKNDDGTVTYTYTLKDGLKWSDGKDLTAADFVFAWNRAASPALASDYGYMFEVVKGYAEMWEMDGENPKNPDAKLAVEAVDAKTLKVTLASDVSYWNELLAFPTYFPVREDVVANEKWATDPATYVGNGPYKLSAWEHNSVITLAKNDNFHDKDTVTMSSIKFYLSDDANSMLTNFKNGDWQMIDDVPTNEIANLKKDYPTEFVVAGQIGTYYVCWNVNAEILPANSGLTGVEAEKARQEIRKAVNLLYDRNYICEDIAQAGQVPASSFVAMGMTNPDGTEFYQTSGTSKDYYGYYNVAKEAFEANCTEALKVLEKYYTLNVAK